MNKPRMLSRPFIIILWVALYLVSVVPIGMAFYAMKSWLGWNVIDRGGFHSLLRCMEKEWTKYQAEGDQRPEWRLFGDLRLDLREDALGAAVRVSETRAEAGVVHLK